MNNVEPIKTEQLAYNKKLLEHLKTWLMVTCQNLDKISNANELMIQDAVRFIEIARNSYAKNLFNISSLENTLPTYKFQFNGIKDATQRDMMQITSSLRLLIDAIENGGGIPVLDNSEVSNDETTKTKDA